MTVWTLIFHEVGTDADIAPPHLERSSVSQFYLHPPCIVTENY